jgi:pyruvate formate lyase activating enzyme
MNTLAAGTASSPPEAWFYEKIAGQTVKCGLCFRSCTITEGERGFCRNRENRRGKLFSLVYGQAAAVQLDPIEKEPMFHQRTIEELAPYTKKRTPADIVALAQKKDSGLSFTYNEPTVFYEFMHDIAEMGAARGMNTIFHTNGGMQAEPMKALLKHMKGVTVDLKGFTADYYRNMSFAKMTPVLETLILIKEQGKWLEVVNLIVPTMNDNMADIKEMCEWINENLGPDVPIHFIRFFPAYKMQHLPPTPVRTLEQARKIAVQAGMRYVYVGNVPGHKYNSTYCPECKKKIISRTHFAVQQVNIKDDKCSYCGHRIPGIWEL